mmetsp:Transcript_31977/g.48949  ORF Transcript_31977/g.48949 Transcript_31977/m.48949 type:complete len:88 (+) Transcript_31977:431-694(+)
MFSAYVSEFGCKGLPRARILEYYNATLSFDLKSAEPNETKPDPYKCLLVNLMIGSVYRDDTDFRQTYLFGVTDFQTWIYLKLACFQF